MDWVIENWKTIGFFALIASNLMAALGWGKYAKMLRVVITGVQDYVDETGNKRVESKIQARSETAKVEGSLKPLVMKVKGGWKSSLNEAK